MDKNIANEHTFIGLVAMKRELFGKAGYVLTKHTAGDPEALDKYIAKLDKLDGALFRKFRDIESADKANDILIMLDKVRVLNSYMKAISSTNYDIPQSMRPLGDVRSPARGSILRSPTSPSKPPSVGYMREDGVFDKYGKPF